MSHCTLTKPTVKTVQYLISSTACLAVGSLLGLSLLVDLSCLNLDNPLFTQHQQVKLHLCWQQTAGSIQYQLGLGMRPLTV
jgi:hypothetical protein